MQNKSGDFSLSAYGMLCSRTMARKKNAAAVELGKRGGQAKVPKGFSALTPEERKANASAAAKKRWEDNKQKTRRS